jgi:hypothetical protein
MYFDRAKFGGEGEGSILVELNSSIFIGWKNTHFLLPVFLAAG